ncbi:MAG: hypothetical protein QOK19_1329 [Solirubrobacteraceae bacterium]|nr:hypothetical protein [Solirubrobacterales bacterium]MEA2215768.1 hypothetical protein [Solirubrobacteraceae bacterium]
MGEAQITRRSLLLAGTGALAGLALRPVAALAGAVQDRTQTGTIELGTLAGAPRTVALPAGVAVVGLQWDRGAHAAARLRVRLASGAWGPWTAAAAQGHGPEAPGPDGAAESGEPLWVGGARELQLRSPVALAGARLRYVRDHRAGALASSAPPAGESAAAASALALAQPVLGAGAGQPPIIARAAWATGTKLPRVAPAYGQVKVAFVHHTENPNGYRAADVPAMLRAIYAFHRDVNGWNDIGYNFVVDLFGRVFEARAGGIDEPVVGAHAGGYNLASTGVAVLGSFSGTPISPAARTTLQRLLAWKLALHGVSAQGRAVIRVNPAGSVFSRYPARARVSLPRIAGHRDADSTNCPGNALYGELPAIRGAVASMSGQPVIATLAAAPASAPAAPPPAAPEAPPAPAAVPMLVAMLKRLDGTPLAGGQIVLQARTVARRGELVTRTALAQGTTDAEGRCLLPASFAAGAARALWVRALYPGGPAGGAAVSRAVRVAPVAGAVTPAPASAPSG